MDKRTQDKRVGLALGGGGARGLAHIGAIQALQEENIPIYAIAGTSMGALVGAWFAVHGEVDSLKERFLRIKKNQILSMRQIVRRRRIGHGGTNRKDGELFRENSIVDFLEKELRGLTFKDTKIPFMAIATDAKTGDEVALSEGELLPAIRASAAVPVAFQPIEINGRLLVDGGFSNPVPADRLKKGTDYVIAIDVSSKWHDLSEVDASVTNLSHLATQALQAVEYQLARRSEEQADIVLRPLVQDYGWLELDKARSIVSAGFREVKTYISDIRKEAGYTAPPKSLADRFIDFVLYGLDKKG